MRRLTHLNLRDCRLLTNDGLRRLAPLKGLKSLALSNASGVTDRGLQCLAELTGGIPQCSACFARDPTWLRSGTPAYLLQSHEAIAPALSSAEGILFIKSESASFDETLTTCRPGALCDQPVPVRDGPRIQRAAAAAAAVPQAHRRAPVSGRHRERSARHRGAEAGGCVRGHRCPDIGVGAQPWRADADARTAACSGRAERRSSFGRHAKCKVAPAGAVSLSD